MAEPRIEDLQNDLDKRYVSDSEEYYERIKLLKGMGYKVFRNSSGKHRVEMNPNYIYEAFGGIFGDIFGVKGET